MVRDLTAPLCSILARQSHHCTCLIHVFLMLHLSVLQCLVLLELFVAFKTLHLKLLWCCPECSITILLTCLCQGELFPQLNSLEESSRFVYTLITQPTNNKMCFFHSNLHAPALVHRLRPQVQ